MSFARSTGHLLITTRGARVTPQRSALSIIGPGTLPVSPWTSRRDQRRCFHWPAAIESSVHAASDSLIALNSTLGLPWYLAIPAMAMAVNLTVRLPLQAYSRSIIRKQMEALPFLRSWQFRHVAMHDRPTAEKQIRRSMSRIFKERGCGAWKTWAPVFSLPFWLVIPEALRRMTDLSGGFLAWLINWGNRKKDLATIDPSPVKDFEGSPSMLQEPSELVDTATSTLHAAGPNIDHGLATGGALWFPDLSVADPYAILPMVLAGSMIYGILPKSSAHRRAVFNLKPLPNESAIPFSAWKLRLLRALVVATAGFGFVTLQLPCAMVLYWTCSSLFSVSLNHFLLDRLMPLEQNRFPPCKTRPPTFLNFESKK